MPATKPTSFSSWHRLFCCHADELLAPLFEIEAVQAREIQFETVDAHLKQSFGNLQTGEKFKTEGPIYPFSLSGNQVNMVELTRFSSCSGWARCTQ
jgi:hypothetical protein